MACEIFPVTFVFVVVVAVVAVGGCHCVNGLLNQLFPELTVIIMMAILR